MRSLASFWRIWGRLDTGLLARLQSLMNWRIAVGVCLAIALSVSLPLLPASASIDNDRYEGNIFALYGSNGGIVPPKTPLDESIAQRVPTLLVYYIEDSSDCKRYSGAIANLQVRYGLGVNFVPLNVDSFDVGVATGPGRYFTGQVPETLLFGPDGDILYRSVGDRPITEVENAMRAVFELAPIEAGDLPRQPFNELQTGFGRLSS